MPGAAGGRGVAGGGPRDIWGVLVRCGRKEVLVRPDVTLLLLTEGVVAPVGSDIYPRPGAGKGSVFLPEPAPPLRSFPAGAGRSWAHTVHPPPPAWGP